MKEKTQKRLTLLLSLCMLASIFPFSTMALSGSSLAASQTQTYSTFYSTIDVSKRFSDVPSVYWAKKYIQILYDKGIRKGSTDGTMSPESPVTKAEAVTVIMRALGFKPASTITITFADTSDIPQWAVGYIQTAVDKGIIVGDTNNKINANSNVTRNELAVMIQRGFKLTHTTGITTKEFTDTIPSWASDSVYILVEKGILSGYGDGSFKGNNYATNAEFDKMICIVLAIS